MSLKREPQRDKANLVNQRASAQSGPNFSASVDHTHPAAILQRAQLAQRLPSQADLLDLQRTIGNRAAGALVQKGAPAGIRDQSPQVTGYSDGVSNRTFDPREIPEPRQFTADEADHSSVADAGPMQKKASKRGNLPDQVQRKMETSFGTDFSDVTVHENSSLAKDLNAIAYTQGDDIHFAPGQYRPESRPGEEILAHELSHVIQNRQGRVRTTHQEQGYEISDQVELEAEADWHGKLAAGGSKIAGAVPFSQATQGSIQRKSAPLQLFRTIPTGATILGINPDMNNIYLACSNLANRVEGRVAGNVNWMQRIGRDLEGSLTANSIPPPFYSSFTETEGINFDWTVSISWRMGEPREVGGASTTQVTRTGGGSVQQGSGTSSSTTDSAEASGSVGGHEGRPGAGGKAGTSTTQGTSTSQQVTVQGGVSRQGTEQARSYSAELVAVITVSGSANFSGTDYINPFKWGTSIGSEITTSGPQSGSYHAGTIDYQESRPT